MWGLFFFIQLRSACCMCISYNLIQINQDVFAIQIILEWHFYCCFISSSVMQRGRVIVWLKGEKNPTLLPQTLKYRKRKDGFCSRCPGTGIRIGASMIQPSLQSRSNISPIDPISSTENQVPFFLPHSIYPIVYWIEKEILGIV